MNAIVRSRNFLYTAAAVIALVQLLAFHQVVTRNVERAAVQRLAFAHGGRILAMGPPEVRRTEAR